LKMSLHVVLHATQRMLLLPLPATWRLRWDVLSQRTQHIECRRGCAARALGLLCHGKLGKAELTLSRAPPPTHRRRMEVDVFEVVLDAVLRAVLVLGGRLADVQIVHHPSVVRRTAEEVGAEPAHLSAQPHTKMSTRGRAQ
jgi:hypothetical protein